MSSTERPAECDGDVLPNLLSRSGREPFSPLKLSEYAKSPDDAAAVQKCTLRLASMPLHSNISPATTRASGEDEDSPRSSCRSLCSGDDDWEEGIPEHDDVAALGLGGQERQPMTDWGIGHVEWLQNFLSESELSPSVTGIDFDALRESSWCSLQDTDEDSGVFAEFFDSILTEEQKCAGPPPLKIRSLRDISVMEREEERPKDRSADGNNGLAGAGDGPSLAGTAAQRSNATSVSRAEEPQLAQGPRMPGNNGISSGYSGGVDVPLGPMHEKGAACPRRLSALAHRLL